MSFNCYDDEPSSLIRLDHKIKLHHKKKREVKWMPVKTYFHRKQATQLKFTKKNRHSATF